MLTLVEKQELVTQARDNFKADMAKFASQLESVKDKPLSDTCELLMAKIDRIKAYGHEIHVIFYGWKDLKLCGNLKDLKLI